MQVGTRKNGMCTKMQNDKIATSDLRPHAEDEQQVKERSAHPSEMDVEALYHELDVHKIEL